MDNSDKLRQLHKFIQDVPHDLWRQFTDMVDSEDNRREREMRDKAMEAIQAAAKQFGFDLDELMGAPGGGGRAHEGDDSFDVSSSTLNIIKEIAPEGLYNPKGPEGKKWFRKPEGRERWNRAPAWLLEEIVRIKGNRGRLNRDTLEILCKRFPPPDEMAEEEGEE